MRITERHVQAIWYDVKLRPRGLFTNDGRAVSVVYPGEWNLGAGPDFKSAVLEIGETKERVIGDVEVHLCPNDWDLHGHGDDPRYRNVVAHVTWRDGAAPTTLPTGCVSLWLGRFKASEPDFSPDEIDLLAYPFARLPTGERPCEVKIGHDPNVAHRILSIAGRHRLRMKARRMAGRLGEQTARRGNSKQVFYEEVMNALGYQQNAQSFRHIAERVPIDAMPKTVELARKALVAAGDFEEWDRTNLRPNNSPEKRLANAAALFVDTPLMTFGESHDFTQETCRTMLKSMCTEHYVGKGRAAAILANVVVPFAMADNRITEIPSWLPPEDISKPVRLTAARMFGRDHNPAAFYATNGLYIQGLLQIYRDYCLNYHPECESCDVASLASKQGQPPTLSSPENFAVMNTRSGHKSNMI